MQTADTPGRIHSHRVSPGRSDGRFVQTLSELPVAPLRKTGHAGGMPDIPPIENTATSRASAATRRSDSSDHGNALLSGKHIIVTGATGGIGQSLVARLTDLGARVSATGTSHQRLNQLRAVAPSIFIQAADITSETDVAAFYSAAHEQFGDVDAVVNLAGVSIPGAIAETDVETFKRVMDVNVLGTFLSCKHAISRLREMDAQIVNVGSMAGTRPNPTAPLYCTAKAAVAMLTDALALQLKDRRVRVTNLTPGGADTPFWGDRPVNRSALLASDDVVDTLVFVLSRPDHVMVHDIRFESTGRERS